MIHLSFEGRRGLLSGTDAKPPSISHDAFNALAKNWIHAMDGRFHSPPSCGCKFDGLVLTVKHRIASNPDNGHFKAGYAIFDGEVTFDVALRPENAEGWLFGEATVERSMKVSHVTNKCSGQATQTESWEFRGRIDEEAQVLRLTINNITSNEKGEWTCKVGSYRSTEELSVVLGTKFKRVDISMAPEPELRNQPLTLTLQHPSNWTNEWLELSVEEGRADSR